MFHGACGTHADAGQERVHAINIHCRNRCCCTYGGLSAFTSRPSTSKVLAYSAEKCSFRQVLCYEAFQISRSFRFSDLFSTHRHPLTTCFLLGVRSLLPPMPAAFDARYVNRRKPEVHHSGCPDLFVKGVRNEPSVCLCHLQWHPQNPHLLCHVFFKEGAESFFNLCVICP